METRRCLAALTALLVGGGGGLHGRHPGAVGHDGLNHVTLAGGLQRQSIGFGFGICCAVSERASSTAEPESPRIGGRTDRPGMGLADARLCQ